MFLFLLWRNPTMKELQSSIDTFRDTHYREGAGFVNEAAKKKYVSHLIILNLIFSLFYSNKILLISFLCICVTGKNDCCQDFIAVADPRVY